VTLSETKERKYLQNYPIKSRLISS